MNSFFEEKAWFDLLLKEGLADEPEQVHLVPLCRADDSVLGALMLMQPRAQRLVKSLDNYYSPIFGPIVPRAVMVQVDWHQVAMRIQKLPHAGIVRLQPLSKDGAFLMHMHQALRAVGYATDEFFCFGNWYEPVHGRSFDAYWRDRPSRLRNTVSRARKRLDQSHRWHIDILDQPTPELAQAIEAFQAVYAKSWKQAEPCPDFMPGLIRLAAQRGVLRLGQLTLDGVVVASQVWVVDRGKANIYKLAYVPGYEKLSLGSVLTAALMAHVIDTDHVIEIDYLMGDDAYKRDWTTQRRERIGLVAFNLWHWRGAWAYGRHHVGRWLKRWAN